MRSAWCGVKQHALYLSPDIALDRRQSHEPMTPRSTTANASTRPVRSTAGVQIAAGQRARGGEHRLAAVEAPGRASALQSPSGLRAGVNKDHVIELVDGFTKLSTSAAVAVLLQNDGGGERGFQAVVRRPVADDAAKASAWRVPAAARCCMAGGKSQCCTALASSAAQ